MVREERLPCGAGAVCNPPQGVGRAHPGFQVTARAVPLHPGYSASSMSSMGETTSIQGHSPNASAARGFHPGYYGINNIDPTLLRASISRCAAAASRSGNVRLISICNAPLLTSSNISAAAVRMVSTSRM
jgi:hypothetical protein